jgi:hypothetical protein
MSDFVYKAIFVAIIGLGLSSPQVSEADGKPVHLTYAGSGIDTAVDTNSDGLPVSLTRANGMGSRTGRASSGQLTTSMTPRTAGSLCPGNGNS